MYVGGCVGATLGSGVLLLCAMGGGGSGDQCGSGIFRLIVAELHVHCLLGVKELRLDVDFGALLRGRLRRKWLRRWMRLWAFGPAMGTKRVCRLFVRLEFRWHRRGNSGSDLVLVLGTSLRCRVV